MARCKICSDKFDPKFFLQKYCYKESCKIKWQTQVLDKSKEMEKTRKPLKKVSDKKALQDIVYKSERIKFLMLPKNKICPITKLPATTIHHKKGRIGDLYLDKKYWVALSMEGHEFVEKNPEWAKKNGYSLNRLSNE